MKIRISMPRNSMSFLKTKLAGLFFILPLVHLQTAEAFAPNYDPKAHFYQSDEATGYNIGSSLYDIKNNEMQKIVQRAVDEVNSMSAPDVFRFARANRIRIPSMDGEVSLEYLVKKFKVEKAVEERNAALIQRMDQLPLPHLTEVQKQTRVATISDDQLIQTSISINFSPATDAIPVLKQKYDPKGNFGYCFLRAHYYANTAGLRGLVKDSIKKVFLVGTMQPLGFIPIGVWQFHVATAVRGDSGAWKVMDNHLTDYQEEASTVTDWYKHYKKWLDTEKEYVVTNSAGQEEKLKVKALFLFFTEPGKIGASSNAYNKEAFYGVDLDGNGKLEGAEVFYNSIFVDVDQFISKTKPGQCDPDRYQPLPSDHQRCSMPAQVRRTKERKALIEQWRATWEQALCEKYKRPECTTY